MNVDQIKTFQKVAATGSFTEAARREIDAGLLKRLDVKGFSVTVDYGLFYPKSRLFSGAAEAFLATLCGLGIFSHEENLHGHPWKTP